MRELDYKDVKRSMTLKIFVKEIYLASGAFAKS